MACSGGPDSVALASLLAELQSKLELTLTLGHVNHAQRASAWQDEAVVLRLGAMFDFPVATIDLPPTPHNEADLRKGRYHGLGELASRYGATAVATGHTAEDQTETVLLALFRGTGLSGLRGMPERRPLATGIALVRPLLGIGRASLRRYCHRRMLPYALDPSNADLGGRRNAVRAALEDLRGVFPALDAAVSRTSDIVRREVEAAEPAALRRRVRAILRDAEVLRDVSFEHIEAAARGAKNARSGRFFITRGVELRIKDGEFQLRRSE